MGCICSKRDSENKRNAKIIVRSSPPKALLPKLLRTGGGSEFASPKLLNTNDEVINKKSNIDNNVQLVRKKSLLPKQSPGGKLMAVPSHLRANGVFHTRESLLGRIEHLETPNIDNNIPTIISIPSTPGYVCNSVTSEGSNKKLSLLALWNEQRKINSLKSLDKSFVNSVSLKQSPSTVAANSLHPIVNMPPSSSQPKNREPSKSGNESMKSFEHNEDSHSSVLSKTVQSDPCNTKPFRPNYQVNKNSNKSEKNVRYVPRSKSPLPPSTIGRQTSKCSFKLMKSAPKPPLYEVDLGNKLGKCYMTNSNNVYIETKSIVPTNSNSSQGTMVRSKDEWVLVEAIDPNDSRTTTKEEADSIPNNQIRLKPNQVLIKFDDANQNNHKNDYHENSQKSRLSKRRSNSINNNNNLDLDRTSSDYYDYISKEKSEKTAKTLNFAFPIKTPKKSIIIEEKRNQEKLAKQIPKLEYSLPSKPASLPQSQLEQHSKNNVYQQRESMTNIVNGIVKRNQESRIKRKSLLNLRLNKSPVLSEEGGNRSNENESKAIKFGIQKSIKLSPKDRNRNSWPKEEKDEEEEDDVDNNNEDYDRPNNKMNDNNNDYDDRNDNIRNKKSPNKSNKQQNNNNQDIIIRNHSSKLTKTNSETKSSSQPIRFSSLFG